MEYLGYALLGVVALAWFVGMVASILHASYFGILALIGLLGIAVLFFKVVAERLSNKEDDYYSRKVDK